MAKRNIRLTGLYSCLKAPPPLSVTPAKTRLAALNNPAKRRMTIAAAHLPDLFTLDIPRLQTQLKMLAKNTLDSLELFFAKQLY
jgi:hypothetical protein